MAQLLLELPSSNSLSVLPASCSVLTASPPTPSEGGRRQRPRCALRRARTHTRPCVRATRAGVTVQPWAGLRGRGPGQAAARAGASRWSSGWPRRPSTGTGCSFPLREKVGPFSGASCLSFGQRPAWSVLASCRRAWVGLCLHCPRAGFRRGCPPPGHGSRAPWLLGARLHPTPVLEGGTAPSAPASFTGSAVWGLRSS